MSNTGGRTTLRHGPVAGVTGECNHTLTLMACFALCQAWFMARSDLVITLTVQSLKHFSKLNQIQDVGA